LARANTAQATQLLAALASTPLSTRELQVWFRHYLTSPSAARARMVAHPRLLLQSLRAQEEERADTRLRAAPEGQDAADVRQLLALIKRLRSRLPNLSREVLPESLLGALAHLRAAVDALHSELARNLDHDAEPDPRCGPNPASARQEPARDQPCAQAIA
jgi:hypothetical protein